MLRINMMPSVAFSETLNLGNTISDVGLPPRRLSMNPIKRYHGIGVEVYAIDKGMESRGDL